jgi:hypothetical protein
LEYFTGIWYILRPFGNVVVIWYIFPRFGILCEEKSGSPGCVRPTIKGLKSRPQLGKEVGVFWLRFQRGCQMVNFHAKKSPFWYILEGLGM